MARQLESPIDCTCSPDARIPRTIQQDLKPAYVLLDPGKTKHRSALTLSGLMSTSLASLPRQEKESIEGVVKLLIRVLPEG